MNDRDGRLHDLFGRRVSLRHRIAPEGGPGPTLSDAVGELADGGTGPDDVPIALVHTRSGTVRVRVADVVAVRAVPPAPPRRASRSAVERLERLCADAWPAPVVQNLGGWRLRAGADGFTRRANSALAVGDPGVPVPDALGEVRRFAAEHAIPPIVSAPEGSRWWRAVCEQGWRIGDDPGSQSIVMVAGLETLAAPVPGVDVALMPRPGPEWSAVFGERDDDATAALRRPILVPDGPALGFGLARGSDGEVLGALRSALVDDHVYLSRLEVLPHARRAGVASALTVAAARWGLDHGGRYAVLQVLRSNTAARTLYTRLGCVEHHRYHYLVPGPDAAA